MKEFILKEIIEGVQKLESFVILDVPDEVVSWMARTVDAVEKMGNQIEWLDSVIGEICA